MGVSERFSAFLNRLKLTELQKADGSAKRENVILVLNQHYWGSLNGTSNSKLVGSWAKLTRIRPPRDVDVLFELPASVHTRYEGRMGNKQSQLLQEVKTVLASSFRTTAIKGDGPVVLVLFPSYNVEVIPSFSLNTGGHWVCITEAGGRYKWANYSAESTAISVSNTASGGNTRDLVRMMKCWQAHCSVPLKSFYIELTVVDFLQTWGNSGRTTVYYDWMVRDYLADLKSRQNGWVVAPGTGERMFLGSGWVSNAETAYARAVKACIHEGNKEWTQAGDQWQMIFGSNIPRVF